MLTGRRRLADVGVPHARGQRRSLAAPTGRRGAAAACRLSPMCCSAWPTLSASAATTSSRTGRALTRRARAHRTRRSAPARSADGALRRRAVRRARAAVRSSPRRLRRRAEVSPADGPRRLLPRWRRARGRRRWLEMVTHHAHAMAAAASYDQLGGGFHRYSVDARWLVPHFEKMLYDNALLAVAYLDAWQATGDEDYADGARNVDYVLRDMTDPEAASTAARRRQRRRGGQVLCLGSGTKSRRRYHWRSGQWPPQCSQGSTAAPNFEGHAWNLRIRRNRWSLSQRNFALRWPHATALLARARGRLLALRARSVCARVATTINSHPGMR